MNQESAFATGQLPDKDGQMYHIENDNLYLKMYFKMIDVGCVQKIKMQKIIR